ncbi:MAG: electron transport complex subunit RsxC [Eubacteriales bacterium]|nr:electron transport complex subunit RsxC [Eubacteriales bacterium]
MLFQKFTTNTGIRTEHHKNTSGCETVKMGVPKKVLIPLQQHIGAQCEPLVQKGDKVKAGQMIGDSKARVSVPIHSSVSGTVVSVAPVLYPGGFYVNAVGIETDGMQEVHEDVKPPVFSDKAGFIKALRSSGLVGLGGAGFPTHIKLSPPEDCNIDTLLINGAECEPYLTADTREMLENTNAIFEGISIVRKMLNIKNVIIGIEKNKPEAIKKMKETAAAFDNVRVSELKTSYPQGAEKTLIYSLTKRIVPSGKLPMDVNCIVMNVNSVSFVSEYAKTGMPLIKKRVTVDGSAVKNPQNVEVLIGTSLADLFEFCGGFKSEPRKILMGGPMMGISQYSLESTILKHTNGILAFDEKDSVLKPESACIKCGRCARACPMNLQPMNINLMVNKGRFEELDKYHICDCIECGNCSYVCPAKRYLVQSIRLGKAELHKCEIEAVK